MLEIAGPLRRAAFVSSRQRNFPDQLDSWKLHNTKLAPVDFTFDSFIE